MNRQAVFLRVFLKYYFSAGKKNTKYEVPTRLRTLAAEYVPNVMFIYFEMPAFYYLESPN